ncbi:hypothetical protein AMTRI_Chr02g222160 [Amborella trichopoda]
MKIQPMPGLPLLSELLFKIADDFFDLSISVESLNPLVPCKSHVISNSFESSINSGLFSSDGKPGSQWKVVSRNRKAHSRKQASPHRHFLGIIPNASKRPFFSGVSIVLGLSCPSRNLSVKPLLLPKTSTPHPPDRTVFPPDCKVIATHRDGLSTQRVDDFEGVDSMVASNIEAAGGEVWTVARGLSWTLVNSQMMVSLLLLD